MPLSNLQTRAVETLVHPYTNQSTFRDTGPLVLERGKGVYVYDTEGKPYLEGMAGPVVHGARLRQRRAGRSCGDADAQAPLRASLHRPEPRPGDRARREAEGDCAGPDFESVL